MTEITEKLADYTMSEIVARVARGLESAAAEYGPDAVDLALMAYRVASIQRLVVGVALILLAYAIYRAWRLFISQWTFDKIISRRLGHAISAAFASLFAAPLVAVGVMNLVSVVHWLSAFGHPEVLIATTALKAAGLMP